MLLQGSSRGVTLNPDDAMGPTRKRQDNICIPEARPGPPASPHDAVLEVRHAGGIDRPELLQLQIGAYALE